MSGVPGRYRSLLAILIVYVFKNRIFHVTGTRHIILTSYHFLSLAVYLAKRPQFELF